MMLALLAFSLALFPASTSIQCMYTLLENSTSQRCAQFDLTLLSHFGPYNITPSGGGYTKYYVKVCDVITTDMPDVCVSKKPAPAYKYSNEGGCYILGDLMKSYAFPLDTSDISKGISIAYSGGDGGVDGYWPTAVIYDLYCDTSGVQHLPSVSYEWPTSTYRVMWRTGYACPNILDPGKCGRPTPPPGWDGLRFRNYPLWYNGAKFGILVTWGLFSVPAYGNESYWKNLESGDPDTVRFHNRVYGCSGVQPKRFPCNGPKFRYQDFAPLFKAEYFDPQHWADLFEKAGAKYVVFTTKYHSGWCNFPSPKHPNWNSKEVGPHSDLTARLTNSIRAKGLRIGFHHSLKEWYNPLYMKDVKQNCSSTDFVDEILIPTITGLVEQYKPDLLLSDGTEDGQCSQDSVKYWKTDQFLLWLYNESPVRDSVITNSNWGFQSFGSYYSNGSPDTGMLRKYKWELPYGIQTDSFGFNYKSHLKDVRNVTQILWQLMATIANNGNFLLNIGPMANGTLHPTFEKVLLDVGDWLKVNSEAVYETIPWKYQTDSPTKQTWYTASVDWNTIYAVTFVHLKANGTFVLQKPQIIQNDTAVSLLVADGEKALPYQQLKSGIEVTIPNALNTTQQPAWTFKLTHVT